MTRTPRCGPPTARTSTGWSRSSAGTTRRTSSAATTTSPRRAGSDPYLLLLAQVGVELDVVDAVDRAGVGRELELDVDAGCRRGEVRRKHHRWARLPGPRDEKPGDRRDGPAAGGDERIHREAARARYPADEEAHRRRR